jgi:hypothetical protein
MTKRTKRGRALASKLNPMIGTTDEIVRVCSLLVRHAVTHDAIQVQRCCTSSDWLDRRDEQVEARIRDLVAQLPHTDEGPFGVKLDGDPRGWTAQLVCPGSLAEHHEGWGRDGIGLSAKRREDGGLA